MERSRDGESTEARSLLERIGLCATCAHVKPLDTGRSTFYQCRLAATDARFARYPVLPVRWCPGHEAAAGSS